MERYSQQSEGGFAGSFSRRGCCSPRNEFSHLSSHLRGWYNAGRFVSTQASWGHFQILSSSYKVCHIIYGSLFVLTHVSMSRWLIALTAWERASMMSETSSEMVNSWKAPSFTTTCSLAYFWTSWKTSALFSRLGWLLRSLKSWWQSSEGSVWDNWACAIIHVSEDNIMFS